MGGWEGTAEALFLQYKETIVLLGGWFIARVPCKPPLNGQLNVARWP